MRSIRKKRTAKTGPLGPNWDKTSVNAINANPVPEADLVISLLRSHEVKSASTIASRFVEDSSSRKASMRGLK